MLLSGGITVALSVPGLRGGTWEFSQHTAWNRPRWQRDFFAYAEGSSGIGVQATLAEIGVASAGVFGWLNSFDQPSDYLVARRCRDIVSLVQVVEGRATTLISAYAPFDPARAIEIRRMHKGLIGLLCGGRQIGGHQQIDPALARNVLFGLYSESSEAVFSDLRIGGIHVPFELHS